MPPGPLIHCDFERKVTKQHHWRPPASFRTLQVLAHEHTAPFSRNRTRELLQRVEATEGKNFDKRNVIVASES